MAREIQRASGRPGEPVGGCGFMLSVAGVIAVIVLHVAAGLSWWWMLAVAGFFVGSMTVAGMLGSRSLAAGDSRVIQALVLPAAGDDG